VPLAKQGFRVTGVDRSAFLLERARRYATDEKVQVEWVQRDMRDFQAAGSYDLAISMYTSFGYFDTSEENQKVLQNIRASLRPGGTFVINVLGKEPLARKFIATDMQELDGVGTVFQHRRVKDVWSHLESEWVIIQCSTAQRLAFSVWIYSGAELQQMLEVAGFDDVRLFGHLDGSPYDVDARRLIAVARAH
jgi:SAM-dependent methyltransferase